MRRLITLFALLGMVLAVQAPAGAAEYQLPRATAAFNDQLRKVAYDGDVVFAGGMSTNALNVDGYLVRRHHLAAVEASTAARWSRLDR